MARNSSEVEQAVSRTLRDSLAKLQQTTGELDQAVNDLVSACASARPSNSLPPMLRARSAAAALAASLEVLSRFVITALQTAPAVTEQELQAVAPRTVAAPAEPELAHEPATPEPTEATSTVSPAVVVPSAETVAETFAPAERERSESTEATPSTPPLEAEHNAAEPALSEAVAPSPDVELREPGPEQVPESVPEREPAPEPPPEQISRREPEREETPYPEPVAAFEHEELTPVAEFASPDASAPFTASYNEESPSQEPPSEESPREEVAFDVLALAPELQELHRRANRVAKVSMQDVKMLRPGDVALGKEHKDLCIRLRDDIEKAHKEYDRRFHSIMDQPVDYFYNWMVEILGDGDPQALGEYPYPSPVLRR